MKKLILTGVLSIGITIMVSSQSTINDVYSCTNEKFTKLTQCFSGNDVTGMYSGGGSSLYFQPDAGVTYSQFYPCVDSYNKDRVDCPTAPLLIIGNGVKKKKVAI